MESKQLMIGDWVIDSYGNYSKIQQIYSVENVLHERCYMVEHNWCLSYVEQLKPITITEEILKANGIDYESGVGIIKVIDGHIHIHGWMANCELYLGMIRYVHELQHALRLCGLNELADNFKLKEE